MQDRSNFTFKINNKKAGSNRTGELPVDRALIAESVELAYADSLANQDEDVKGAERQLQAWDDGPVNTERAQVSQETMYK